MDDGIGFLVGLGVLFILIVMGFDFFTFFGNSTFVLVLDDDGGTVVGFLSSAASSYMWSWRGWVRTSYLEPKWSWSVGGLLIRVKLLLTSEIPTESLLDL